MVKYQSIYVCHTDEHVFMAGRHPELYLYKAFSKNKRRPCLKMQEYHSRGPSSGSREGQRLSFISCLFKINPANREVKLIKKG